MAKEKPPEPVVDHLKHLIPDESNPRRHNPRNIGMIVDSLHAVGAARSIVIDENNKVLAGNGTIQAAAEAGIEKVRVIEADGNEIIAVRRRGLTEEQKRKLSIADNRTSELAEWDAELLGKINNDYPDMLKESLTDIEKDRLLQYANEPQFQREGSLTKQDTHVGVNSIELLFEDDDTTKVVSQWLRGMRDRFNCESSGMALYQYIKSLPVSA